MAVTRSMIRGAASFDERALRRQSTEIYTDAVDGVVEVEDFGSPSKQPGAKSRLTLTRSLSTISLSSQSSSFDAKEAKEYLDKRVMTPVQEMFNSITMLPSIIYCLHFILAGCWVRTAGDNSDVSGDENATWVDTGCINSEWFPYLPALPPLPVAAAALGIALHAPFSMLFHWKCATQLKPSERIAHWSRRLDHAAIHFASACAAYATSGNMLFTVLSAIYNLYCALLQFEETVQPKRNLAGIGSSIGLYLIPVVVYGHYALFLQFVAMFAVCGYLFVGYPLGGWSHGLFHLVLGFLPYLVMTVALELESCQAQARFAARCTAMTALQ